MDPFTKRANKNKMDPFTKRANKYEKKENENFENCLKTAKFISKEIIDPESKLNFVINDELNYSNSVNITGKTIPTNVFEKFQILSKCFDKYSINDSEKFMKIRDELNGGSKFLQIRNVRNTPGHNEINTHYVPGINVRFSQTGKFEQLSNQLKKKN